jgi:hypothetical protein
MKFMPESKKGKVRLGLATGLSLLAIGGAAGGALTHDTVDSWNNQRALNGAKAHEATALIQVQADNEQLTSSIESADGGAVVKNLRINLANNTVEFTDNAGQGGSERDCSGNMETQKGVAEFVGSCATTWTTTSPKNQ